MKTLMEILDWIDKPLSSVKQNLLFGKYFDSILLEQGTDVYFLFNPELGVDVIVNEDYFVRSIHFYSGTQASINQFRDDLPFNLNFSFSQKESREILGIPKELGGGDFSILYGKTPPWDKYYFENFAMNLQFSEDKTRIDLVTIDSLNHPLSSS